MVIIWLSASCHNSCLHVCSPKRIDYVYLGEFVSFYGQLKINLLLHKYTILTFEQNSVQSRYFKALMCTSKIMQQSTLRDTVLSINVSHSIVCFLDLNFPVSILTALWVSSTGKGIVPICRQKAHPATKTLPKLYLHSCISILVNLLFLFWKIKLSLYLWIPPINICIPEAMSLKLGICHLARVAWADLNGVLRKSLPSVCLYAYPSIITRQRLGKNFAAATKYTHNNRSVAGVVLYAVRVVLKESRLLVLPSTSCY
jgi:hypothetical protein